MNIWTHFYPQNQGSKHLLKDFGREGSTNPVCSCNPIIKLEEKTVIHRPVK